MHSTKLANKSQNNQTETLPISVMDSPVRHSIQAQDLTDEAFAPYGDIIKPRISGEQFDRAYSYDPLKEHTHVKLVMTNGEPM